MEKLVAVFGIGMVDELRIALFGVKHRDPVMRTLIFTDQRAVFAVTATPDDVDPSIKRHTPEYEAALIRVSRERASSEAQNGAIDSLPEAFSISYADVKKITTGSLILPKLEIERRDKRIFRFTPVSKQGFEEELDTVRKAVPDKF